MLVVICRAIESSQPVEEKESGGGVAALRMAEEPENVIFSYTDAQALEDGVLIEVSCAVNRVTRAVFDHFALPMGIEPVTGLMQFDFTPVTAAIRTVLGVTPDEDGWRKLLYEGKELWLVLMKYGGSRLCFPRTTDVRVVCGPLNCPDSFYLELSSKQFSTIMLLPQVLSRAGSRQLALIDICIHKLPFIVL